MRRTTIALIPLLLSLQGCCSLFGLFGCGVGTPLVPITWDSPKAALQTVKTAIRVGDSKVIYESLSEGFKKANGVDGLAFDVAWERMQNQVLGLNLAGEADVVHEEATPATKDRPATHYYRLETHGYRFGITFVALAYWDLAVEDPESKELAVFGDYVGDINDIATINPRNGNLTSTIREGSLAGVQTEQLAFVRFGRTWRIAKLAQEK